MERNKIYNADCFDIMAEIPSESIDLIVTDPPYGLNYNGCLKGLAGKHEWVFNGWKKEDLIGKERPILEDDEETADKNFIRLLKEASRILKKDGCCCCCCCGGGPKPLFARWTLLMDEYLQFKQAVVWNKLGLGMGIHYRRNYEFMLIAHRKGGKVKWNGGNSTPNVISSSKIIPSKDQHPTEKPVKLMAHFIYLHSDEGDIVLDPFMGAGSTIIAAMDLRRQYIGIEKDERFFKMASKKIEKHKQQGRLL